MAEYIDREALLTLLKQDIKQCETNIAEYKKFGDDVLELEVNSRRIAMLCVLRMVNTTTAADVEEVKHGRWIAQNISGEQTWCCSECKTIGSPHWKRCPVCEAKMDGRRRDED